MDKRTHTDAFRYLQMQWEVGQKNSEALCRSNTTHNLCTPCRDATIMKESRCELIKSAKPEKGTPESIRVGSNFIRLARAVSPPPPLLSFFFFFRKQKRKRRRETRGNFLIYTVRRVCPYFFRKFFFHNAKDTLELKCRFERSTTLLSLHVSPRQFHLKF